MSTNEDPQINATETKSVQSSGENASRLAPSDVERTLRDSGCVDIRWRTPSGQESLQLAGGRCALVDAEQSSRPKEVAGGMDSLLRCSQPRLRGTIG
mgnify:CR=1 FL=1